MKDMIRKTTPVKCRDIHLKTIFYGNGIFGNFRTHAPVPNVQLVRELSKSTLVIIISEYNTSKLCCGCKAILPTIRTSEHGQRMRTCTFCQITKDRDTSATLNMKQSTEYIVAVFILLT